MPITLPVNNAVHAATLKRVAHARHYGAGELMLATMTGHYPPPHDELDLFVTGQLELKL